jgi:hypothetical protein
MTDTPNTSPRRTIALERIAFGLAVVLIPVMLAVAAWTSQEFPNRVDRYLFEQMGETVLNGGTVYLDCWDNKPPGLCWLNALILWIGGRSTYAITVVAVVAGVSAVAATGWSVSRILGRPVATVTALIFTILLAQREFDACTNGTEFYAMVADAFAAAFVVAAMYGAGRRRLLYAFLAGVCWGIGGLCKQTAVAGPIAVVLGVMLGIVAGVTPRTRWMGRVALAAVGALLVLIAAAGILYFQGALAEAYRAVIAINLLPQRQTHSPGLFNSAYVFAQLTPIAGVLLLAGIGAVVGLIPECHEGQAPPPSGEKAALLSRPITVFMIVWLLVATYGVGIGPSHMPRYWHGIFVPLMWLAAQGIALVLASCRMTDRRLSLTVTVGTITLAVIFFKPLVVNIYDAAFQARHFATADSERGRLIEIGNQIRALTSPEERIYVWGYSPGVYRFSSRTSACRFSGVEKIDGVTPFSQSMAEELFACLKKREPKVIIVERFRYPALLEDRVGTATLPGLSTWFSGRYEETGSLHSLMIFVRKNADDGQMRPARPPIQSTDEAPTDKHDPSSG